MSTGRGKNDKGDTVPAHFIQVMNATLNGKPLLEAHLGTGIAKNPYFTFYVTDAKVGDAIAVHWQDNQSYSGQGNVVVSSGVI
jgi:thiosulfate oxidation carrier complex protein SoxZ